MHSPAFRGKKQVCKPLTRLKGGYLQKKVKKFIFAALYSSRFSASFFPNNGIYFPGKVNINSVIILCSKQKRDKKNTHSLDFSHLVKVELYEKKIGNKSPWRLSKVATNVSNLNTLSLFCYFLIFFIYIFCFLVFVSFFSLLCHFIFYFFRFLLFSFLYLSFSTSFCVSYLFHFSSPP